MILILPANGKVQSPQAKVGASLSSLLGKVQVMERKLVERVQIYGWQKDGLIHLSIHQNIER